MRFSIAWNEDGQEVAYQFLPTLKVGITGTTIKKPFQWLDNEWYEVDIEPCLWFSHYVWFIYYKKSYDEREPVKLALIDVMKRALIGKIIVEGTADKLFFSNEADATLFKTLFDEIAEHSRFTAIGLTQKDRLYAVSLFSRIFMRMAGELINEDETGGV